MLYYSDITKEYYKTEQDCISAEEKYETAQKIAEEKREKLRAEKDKRRQEVIDAYEKANELAKKYREDYNINLFSHYLWW